MSSAINPEAYSVYTEAGKEKFRDDVVKYLEKSHGMSEEQAKATAKFAIDYGRSHGMPGAQFSCGWIYLESKLLPLIKNFQKIEEK